MASMKQLIRKAWDANDKACDADDNLIDAICDKYGLGGGVGTTSQRMWKIVGKYALQIENHAERERFIRMLKREMHY